MVFPISLEGYHLEEVVIIGGGVAGLSCLNALLDQGISALLIEGSSIGTPKMCGEFLAPIAAQQLQRWDVDPLIPIPNAAFYAGIRQLDIHFTEPSAAISRSQVELKLAARARKLGGRIRENTYIEHTTPATETRPFHFKLSTGEIIEAKNAFFATGKLGNNKDNKKIALPYFGFKLHFSHTENDHSLKMFSLDKAYLGIVPITETMSNCACLAKREAVDASTSPDEYFRHLTQSHPVLKKLFTPLDLSAIDILSGRAPKFTQKKPSDWPNSYWIGDALVSLYPAIGSGFAHSVDSAIQAVQSYLKQQPHLYRINYSKSIKTKVLLGNVFNAALLQPKMGELALPLLKRSPKLVNFVLKKLDYV
ncbi:MAG: flavin-dependent dehydrogenase [Oleiphilaceae bacterium]|jgi:flavin-dependent dehydrogenase